MSIQKIIIYLTVCLTSELQQKSAYLGWNGHMWLVGSGGSFNPCLFLKVTLEKDGALRCISSSFGKSSSSKICLSYEPRKPSPAGDGFWI